MANTSTITINASGQSVTFQSIADIGSWGVGITTDTAKTLTIKIGAGGASERTLTADLNNPIGSETRSTTSSANDTGTVVYPFLSGTVKQNEAVEVVVASAGILTDTVLTSDAITATTAGVNNSGIPNTRSRIRDGLRRR